MNTNKIYILSEAVHSGKTTALQQWLRNNALNAAGILAPDVAGRRQLYDIAEKKYHEFEMAEGAAAEDTLLIGKYHFSKQSFEIARDILTRSMQQNPEWLIVDEVGKLEIDDKGLEPALTDIVNFYKTGKPKGRLILVVRDHLMGAAADKYGLNTDMVIHKSFFA